jgi:predicted short-subunit dehydrogenase-like oxidoreductase (DUF2520 family)
MRTRSISAAEPLLVIGRGRLGAALVRGLRSAGVSVSNQPGRAVKASSARVIVIAVRDPAIASVAEQLRDTLTKNSVVLHTAGGEGVSVLESCREVGASVGVMHPLVSFASARHIPPLSGKTFVIDGDPAAIKEARRLTRALAARPLVLPIHGPAYHAVAALLANGAAALAATAIDALVLLGASRRDAERASAGLLETVASNIDALGLPLALTGPIVRGDAGAVRRHREALAKLDHSALTLYDAVAPAILDVAVRAGLHDDEARAIRSALVTTPARNKSLRAKRK